MPDLHLHHFMQPGDDFERAQYRILSGLGEARTAFSRNIIYPHLGHLVHLHQDLRSLLQQLDGLREAMPGSLTALDPETGEPVYDKPASKGRELGFMEDLIHWALPHIKDAIGEGSTVFEFVEDNLYLEEVGILPSYVEEGYLITPDPQRQQQHILQYQISVFTRADERYRSLKTTLIKSIPQRGVYPSPQSIKLDLLTENRDLPNPATYFFATDLDFPFEATVLPVAKRKLMQYLAEQGGRA
ncbi:MAG TPA: hypothetical protein VKP65_25630 [Rhodothermales bacterium]|nr:hypothetical protein [Rhodothermales bacterium]